METLCYFDGLGRPVQTVKRKFTPSQSDLVDFIDYDDHGRAWRRWLPVPIAGKEGAFIHNLPQKAAPLWGDPRPYEETLYEPSPLNRPALETKAGQDWKDHPSRVTYTINSESGESACCRYQVNKDGALVKNGNYPAGTLHLTRMVNEDRAVSLIFTDKQGRTILQRNKDGNTSHDTYYVYDRRHLLRYVLPPMMGGHITLDHLDLYAFQYRYDGLGRCVEQKRPGCQPTMYVYDQADHRVFTQDGNQRPLHEWTCTFSDALGREAVTGLYTSATAPPVGNSIVKAIPETSGATLLNSGYTVSGLNGSPQKLLSVCYYDNYDFLNLPSVVGLKAQLEDREEAGYGKRYVGTVPAIAAQGKLTGSRTWIPESNQELITVFYYDDKGRVVQKRSTNHLAGKESQCFAYTFTGKPTKIKSVHFVPNKAEQTQVYTYAYGISERLISVTHQLNNHPTIKLAEYTYDEQGRISAKKLHAPMPANSPFAQTCSYLYNIQGWPTSLSADKFTQKLSYANGAGTPCYSGNISSMTWKSGNEPTVRGYKFSYDGLSRLTQSHYGESEGINANAGRFNEVVTAYDLNGNICSLQRSGKTSDTGYGTLDALAIVHRGNQLKSVDDAAADPTFGGGSNFTDGSKNSATEYVYDGNGNLTQDFNKKIAKIQYNLLNLPNRLQWTNGNATSYLYSADGIKRRVTHQTASGYVGVPMGSLVPLTASQIAQTTTTDYCGNVIYENGVLSRILTEEGYITLSGTTPTYHYYLKDHQGNNRVVMSQSGVVEQVNHYYPFGGLFAEGIDTSKQAYKYNGKELDRKHGLNWYDYQARMKDEWWFTGVDPFCEKYYSMSPYTYCFNNPVRFIDPNGKDGWDVLGGILHSVGSNLSLGFMSANTQFVSSANDYNIGRDIGDMISVAMGTIEFIVGGGEAVGGGAATVLTAGSSSLISVPVAVKGVATAAHGGGIVVTAVKSLSKQEGRVSQASSTQSERGTRTKNHLPDTGEPNSVQSNTPGTTKKKYGSDGNVQKEYNQGHIGQKVPKNEKKDHIHDYKPNPNNPTGKGDRQPGRPLKKNELIKDFK